MSNLARSHRTQQHRLQKMGVDQVVAGRRRSQIRAGWRAVLIAVGIGAVPMLSAVAGSMSIPVLRDNTTNAISRTTAPVTGPVNKVIAPAADITPRIGDTSAPLNDSAMFRANTALQNRVASDSSGYISQ